MSFWLTGRQASASPPIIRKKSVGRQCLQNEHVSASREPYFLEPNFLHTDGEDYYQYCSAIPVGTLLAQTFDTELLEEVGRMIGAELEEFGVTLWLAPGMNIHRNPALRTQLRILF